MIEAWVLLLLDLVVILDLNLRGKLLIIASDSVLLALVRILMA